MQVKLRHQFKYLEKHGCLEEFVRAKNEGDGEKAKEVLSNMI